MTELPHKWTEYRYGKITKRLRETVGYIVIHQDKILKNYNTDFDYPEYWGIPKRLANGLSPDEVDWIQENTINWFMKNRWPE